MSKGDDQVWFAQRLGQRPAPDPVQQAVDNYILMERKAAAWDRLTAAVKRQASYLPMRVEDLDYFMDGREG